MKQFFVKDFWLKMLALFFAFAVWVYVVSELNKGTPEEKEFFGKFLPYKVSALEVPIKVALIGKPLTGYRVLNDRIVIRPSTCLLIAPRNLIKTISYVTTADIDISELTKSVARQVKIRPVGPGIFLEKDFFVNIVIPVERVEYDKR